MDSFLVTVSGRERPDLLPALAVGLVDAGVELLDLELSTLRGSVLAALLVRAPADGRWRLALEALAAERKLRLSIEPAPPERDLRERHVVTALGSRLGAPELRAVAELLARHGGVVLASRRLSATRLAAWELDVALHPGADAVALRRDLLALATEGGFDLALQREGILRRAKRLVVFDMDSTLIPIEVIDELARVHGVGDRVAAITERAMRGEMDYDESLRQRVALLAGLREEVLHQIAARLPLTEGAELLVRALRRLGYRVAVVSGGFSVAAAALQRRLGLDEAHSNRLEVRDGALTGRVVGPIVNAQRKAELLEAIARREGIPLEQTIAVGDGANDRLMLEKAGLGIAFRAKPALREAADCAIGACGLDAILFLLGLTEAEVAELAG